MRALSWILTVVNLLAFGLYALIWTVLIAVAGAGGRTSSDSLGWILVPNAIGVLCAVAAIVLAKKARPRRVLAVYILNGLTLPLYLLPALNM